MKYFVNPQGRPIQADESKLDNLLQRGFVEITKDQFSNGKYFPQFDRGPIDTTPSVKASKKVTQKEKRTHFTTTIV
jgi:hypothetical protein